MIDTLQVIADMMHLMSYAVLIRQIFFNKSVHGRPSWPLEISYRTQEMYMAVYICRYGDLLWNRYSIYLTLMKLIYIGLTGFIIYLVRVKKPYCLVRFFEPGVWPPDGHIQPLPLHLPICLGIDYLLAHLLWTSPLLWVLLVFLNLAWSLRSDSPDLFTIQEERSVLES